MGADNVHRTLIVANRTATTMELRCEVRRRARERPTAFALLVPALPPRHDDWTPERAAALSETCAHARPRWASGGPLTAVPSLRRHRMRPSRSSATASAPRSPTRTRPAGLGAAA